MHIVSHIPTTACIAANKSEPTATVACR